MKQINRYDYIASLPNGYHDMVKIENELRRRKATERGPRFIKLLRGQCLKRKVSVINVSKDRIHVCSLDCRSKAQLVVHLACLHDWIDRAVRAQERQYRLKGKREDQLLKQFSQKLIGRGK
jgi:hypothetical protein